MFKISNRPRLTVRVPLVIQIDGQSIDSEFGATFQILPLSRTSEKTMADEAGQVSMLREVVVDLQDIAGDDEQPVPFTPELLAALIDRSEVRLALIKAYFEAQKQAAVGN